MNMASKGRVYLPGDGSNRANPISTEDLARVVADLLEQNQEIADCYGEKTVGQFFIDLACKTNPGATTRKREFNTA